MRRLSFTGVIVALPVEARCLAGSTERDSGGGETRLRVTGIGAERAASGAQALLEAGASALVSWGTAGALDPDLGRGSLLLPETVIDGQKIFTVDATWRKALLERLGDLPVCAGALLRTEYLLDTVEAKLRVRQTMGASAVDMESGAVARVAAAAGRPFVAIRAVVDRASDTLPILLDATHRWHAATLLRSLARRPAGIVTLVHLGIGFAAAHRTLTHVARRLGPGLCCPPM